MVIVLTMWYKRTEQPLRNGAALCITSSIVNGLLWWGFGQVKNSPIASWRYMFLALGAFTVLYGIIMFLVLQTVLPTANGFPSVKRLSRSKDLTWEIGN